MNMHKTIRDSRDGIGGILFLYVRMKGFVHHAEVGMIDALDERAGVGAGCEEVTFKAVQVLNREHDTGFFRLLRRLTEHIGSPLFLLFSWRRAAEDAQRRMEWPGHDLRAENR